uniref:Uncharacterized protein n=3 Tax=unclassified bacterial viruses TaxID=12333 RepID=A0AAU6W0B7_9VIRU
MKRITDIYLSERIQELLKDGSLTQIIEHVRTELKDEWQATAPSQTADRDLIYHELHALNRVEEMIQVLVNDLMFQRGEN